MTVTHDRCLNRQFICSNDKETIALEQICKIECLIFELDFSNSEKSVQMIKVRKTRHFPVEESGATVGTPFWDAIMLLAEVVLQPSRTIS